MRPLTAASIEQGSTSVIAASAFLCRLSPRGVDPAPTGNNNNDNGGKRTEFVNKTFRLSKAQVRRLEADAVRAGTSTNGFITSIITRFIEWDRFANEVDFLSLAPNMVEGILNCVDEETMERAGKYVAQKSCFKDICLHIFQDYNPTLFSKAILLFDRYANQYRVQGERGENGGTVISLYHDYGRKWSVFIANLLHNELLRLGVIDHTFEISENAVVFGIQSPLPLPSDHLTRDNKPYT